MNTPLTLVYAEDVSEDVPDQPVVEKIGFLENVTFEEILDLAYVIGDETHPLLEWGIEHNANIV